MVSVLITRLLKGEVDYPAPIHCPECGSKRVATKTYPYNGKIYENGYCPECEYPYFPKPLGTWSPWNADWGKSIKKDPETVKQRRERMLHGRGRWG